MHTKEPSTIDNFVEQEANKSIILANPRGFCAGVERAINVVEQALNTFGAPIYVRHEIVHNKFVVEKLRKQGAIFVDEVGDVPFGAVVIFSAHGVSDKVESDAQNLGLKIIDATCPLVKKVHLEAKNNELEGRTIILIGHIGHPEVEGTAGRVKKEVIIVSSVDDVQKIPELDHTALSYVTQTTLSVDDTKEIINALKERFPRIVGPELKDICYATQNRQNAVRDLAAIADVILVIGSVNSSNSNRLRDLAVTMGRPAHLINEESDIDLSWFKNAKTIGITAGASAPEELVLSVVEFLKHSIPVSEITHMEGKQENIKFKIPEFNL